VSSGASATFYLQASMPTTFGQLAVPAGANVTLDLLGCDLTITSPGAGLAAISVPSTAGLTIEDTSSSVATAQGTLTATAGTGDNSTPGGGAGIGGDGGVWGPGLDSGRVTIDGANVIAAGGGGSYSNQSGGTGGGGAGIGGGGGGAVFVNGASYNGGSLSGQVAVAGGAVSASGGSLGGAGIGGGGAGYPGAGSFAGGDADGTVLIEGGTVTATGSDQGADLGGGEGNCQASCDISRARGTAGPVILSGGQLAALPQGPGFDLRPGVQGSLSVTGSASLAGETYGGLTVDQGAQLAIPAGSSLVLDGGGTNDGSIVLGGALVCTQNLSPHGCGDLVNAGSITVAGDAWFADGSSGSSASRQASWPNITGNAYELTFSLPSGQAVMPMRVFARTLSSSGESLPVEPYGRWVAGKVAVTSTTDLAGLASGGIVALRASYSREPTIRASLSSSAPKNARGWWHSPVTVRFTCATPSGTKLTNRCPSPAILSRSAGGQSVTRTISASNGAVATVKVSGIKIDRNRPAVRITGVTNRGFYLGRAPRVRCRATEQPSGVASCKLEIRTRHVGRRLLETRATAVATTVAGSSRTVTYTFTVAKAH
jgi:hypothetical protein